MAYITMDYDTAERLGESSEELARERLGAGAVGAVGAYRDDAGVWQYVATCDVEHARRHQGREVRTVYVMRP